jgi:competence protein ComEC
VTGRTEPDAPFRLDLRLAGFALSTWAAALASLYLSSRAGLMMAGAALTGAVVTGVGLVRKPAPTGRAIGSLLPPRRWAGPVRWISVAVLLGTVCGSIATAARVSVREAGPLAALVRESTIVDVDLVIRDDPRPVQASAGRPSTYVVTVELTTVRSKHPPTTLRLDARAMVLGSSPAWRSLLPGQHASASGRLLASRGGDLRAAVLSVRGAPTLHGRPPWHQRAAGALRSGLQRACEPLPELPGGLLPGLVVGDTSRLDPALEEDFRTTGMTHLTAVSGANLAIVVGVVLAAARWARAGPVLTAVVSALALIGFVIPARPSPSVVRAAAMAAVGLLGLASGRPRAAVPALSAGVAVLILLDPELAADPGFTLSVLATAGLLLLAPVWRDGLRRRGWPAGAAEALAVPAAAQVACAPVIAGLSGAVSLVAVPANLIAAPAVPLATLLGVTAAVVSPVWPAGAEFTAWLGHWPARWLVLVATQGARVPAGALPWPGGTGGAVLLAAITVALLVAARRRTVRRLVGAVAMAAVLGTVPVRVLAPGWPPPRWLIVACAVGQGDAVVLPAGPGRAVVVDAGPEPNAVDHCLRRLNVRQVVLFVVSHFHADHVGGVDGVFRGRRVLAVVTPDWPEPVGGRAAVARQAAAAGAPVHTVGPGWRYATGGMDLTTIGPVAALHGTKSDPNNNSLVIRIRRAGRTLLLPGDAETEEQQELLTRLGAATLRADILKVAHHGSPDQDPSFLDAVHPAVALVSVGLGNDYGHPNAALLSRLARSGARVLRTDLSGDVAAVVAGPGVAVSARGDPP